MTYNPVRTAAMAFTHGFECAISGTKPVPCYDHPGSNYRDGYDAGKRLIEKVLTRQEESPKP